MLPKRSAAMSPHHYFAIFLLAINAVAATVASNENQQTLIGAILEFNLDLANLDKASYQTFITDLRDRAKDAKSQSNPPILPPSSSDPDMLNVVLQLSPKEKVEVRFRRDNLYVRGYRMQTNQWMELREGENDKLNLIDESKYLPFFGSYTGLERAAGTTVTNINFSKNSLIGAVRELFNYKENQPQQKVAKSFIFMALMISEAARFKDVSSFFKSKLEVGANLPSWTKPDLLTNWSQFSRIVQCYDKYGEKYKYTPVEINKKKLNTVKELRQIFGIMLKTSVSETICKITKLADEDDGKVAVVLLSADM